MTTGDNSPTIGTHDRATSERGQTTLKAAVLGAGSWGTALASVLCENGHETTLWARSSAHAAEINQSHRNARYLPAMPLPVGLHVTSSLVAALTNVQLVVYAVPSSAIRALTTACASLITSSQVIAHAIKGFEPSTLQRISEVLGDVHEAQQGKICVVAGPSHAEEVMARLPTVIVSACADDTTAEFVQDALMSPALRVYTQSDVVGVELGGALKNIIALGVGIVDGLGFGDNAKAAVMTRGLAEIRRLGERLGAEAHTFAGLTGVGDLIATCTSRHSRNLRAGRLIGQGTPPGEAVALIGMVVEGIPAVDAALALARQNAVDMPITTALHAVLGKEMTPGDAAEQLMGRAKRREGKVDHQHEFW